MSKLQTETQGRVTIVHVRIAPSPIHGRGVFANELVEEDHWQYVYGDVRSILPGDPVEHYGVEWDDGKTYIPFAPWCCVNHSNDPNCEITEEDEYPMLYITALRDIEPNEELTIDYGHDPSEN